MMYQIGNIPVQIVRSRRKTISLEIKKDCRVVLRVPNRMPKRDIVRFLNEKQSWLEENYAKMVQRNKVRMAAKAKYHLSDSKIHELAEQAVEVVPKRVAHYAARMDVTYGRITIRHQRTRWGSCSSNGNLNFNCLLMLAPPEVLDYVVVHELCHRKYMNHSKQFWAEVAKVMPDYKKCERWLKRRQLADWVILERKMYTILTVEDDLHINNLLKKRLARQGMPVVRRFLGQRRCCG